MSQAGHCRALLAECIAAFRATVPPRRVPALLALLSLGEHDPFATESRPQPSPGWNLALRLCVEHDVLERESPSADSASTFAPPLPPDWAPTFLECCNQIARVAAVLDAANGGHQQIQQLGPRHFACWRVGTLLSTEERERIDFDWWSAHLARRVDAELPPLPDETTTGAAADAAYRGFGRTYLARFACQHSYPAESAIGGTTFARFDAILAHLIGRLRRERDRRQPCGDADAPIVQDEAALVADLASTFGDDPEAIGAALAHLTLDADNAAYHSAAPGRAAPPLIRLPDGRIAWSARGLLGTPYLFLTRELRRRHGQEYNNRAHLREGIFRRDLYGLFTDKRFIHSPDRVELRLERQIRTDLDALIFDRKTGTLGIFELKSQDPFAGSSAERQYQRDNFFHANHQVSTIARWIQRHGADEILARFDAPTAKKFRVQRVHLFVLGRYLAHFSGGPAPDRRAAWGSWVDLLRVTGDAPVDGTARNPLSTLDARLRDLAPPAADPSHSHDVIELDGLRLVLYQSFAAYRGSQRPG